jgi:hypothetical protein
LGVFFLSVEAIKLENLYKLRDRFLLPMDHALQPGMFQPLKTEWTPEEFRADQLVLRHFFLSHYCAGLAIVTVGLSIGSYLSPTIASICWNVTTPRRTAITLTVPLLALLPIAAALLLTRKVSLIAPTAVMVGMSIAIFPVGILPMFLGEAAHQGSRFIVARTLRFLELIARGTPTGTIGILGFIAVCFGKIAQLLARSVQQ